MEKEREDDYGISSFAVSLKSGTEEEGRGGHEGGSLISSLPEATLLPRSQR